MLTFLKNRLTNQYSRFLTNNEKQLAKSVFGDSLQLDCIQLKTAWWVLSGYAVSPNGNIYYHKSDWQEDFATLSFGKRAWLIHELTHCWQVQQGIAVFWCALFNRKYCYKFQKDKSFFDYGVEQQAKMVEDYYIRRTQQKNCDDWINCIPFLKK